MKTRLFVSLAMISLICVSAIPVQGYGGHSISRAEIDNFTLTDQNGDNWSFEENSKPINVVSFIFTSCPDVCPVLTQNLKAVESGLDGEIADDVQFVSISVDPARDTPEVMTEYMELHGVTWPHLTGDNATLEDIWATFGVVVQRDVIDSHAEAREGNSNHSHEDMGFDMPLVYYGTENNSLQALEFEPTGWTLFSLVAEDAGWTVNSTNGQFGNLVSGINGVESPSDWSWWWSLKIWNSTNSTWEDSPVGIDGVNASENNSIAWVASNANSSLLTPPVEEGGQVQIVYPNNTTVNHVKVNFTAYDLSITSFMQSGYNYSAPDTQYGHYLESLNDLAGPEDFSWWWRLSVWNNTANAWEESPVGMDLVNQPGNIAWTPSYIALENMTRPGENTETQGQDCNGHGWLMGSGSSMHCMCDDGYEWPQNSRLGCIAIEDTEQYFVGHSTLTYILNENLKPMIVWAGDDWSPEDFNSDIEEFAASEGLIESSDRAVPAVNTLTMISMIGACAIIVGLRKEN